MTRGRLRDRRSIAGWRSWNVKPDAMGPATWTGSHAAAGIPASPRALRMPPTSSITASSSASIAGSRSPATGQLATIRRSGSSSTCGRTPHSSSVTNGMTGCNSRRYASRASTSVHHVASRAASGSEVSASLALASSRPQSQNSDQIASYRDRVISANWRSPRARSTALIVAARRDRIHRSAGPRWAGSGSRRGDPDGIDAGRDPRTKRVAFHSLLAKFRALSILAVLNFWSRPGVAPWIRAKRSASAPVVSMISSGSTTLPVVLDIFLPYGSRIRPER